MLIMPSFVMAFVTAMRAGYKVSGAEAGGAIIEIRKEKNGGCTLLASGDDIPSAILGPDKHGEDFFLSGSEIWGRWRPGPSLRKSGKQ
jgi:hypothetical protein